MTVTSFVLNLPCLVKDNSIFELISFKDGAKPYYVAIDYSAHLNRSNIDITDNVVNASKGRCICANMIKYEHGTNHEDKIDNRKVIYSKYSHQAITFLSMETLLVEVSMIDPNGIYTLTFRVPKDTKYDSLFLDHLSHNTTAEFSYPETDGYVSTTNLMEDIIEKYDTIFSSPGTIVYNPKGNIDGKFIYNLPPTNPTNIKEAPTAYTGSRTPYTPGNLFCGSGENTAYSDEEAYSAKLNQKIKEARFDQYDIDYDLVTFILYGCKMDQKMNDFSRTYTANQLFRTSKIRSIEELPDGTYFGREDKNTTSYFQFDFTNRDLTAEREDYLYTYDPKSGTFLDGYGGKIFFDLDSICVGDDDGKIYQLNKDRYGNDSGKYVDEKLRVHDRNYFEFTLDWARYTGSNADPEDIEHGLADTLIEALDNMGENKFLKIKFDIEADTGISDPANINSYRVANGDYYYPSLADTNKFALGKTHFNAAYHALFNDANRTGLKTFHMYDRIFKYMAEKIPGEASVTLIQLEDDEERNEVVFLGEHRTHPILYYYIKTVLEWFYADSAIEDYDTATAASLEVADIFYSDVMFKGGHTKFTKDNKKILAGTTDGQFYQKNYYELTRQAKDTMEANIIKAVNMYLSDPDADHTQTFKLLPALRTDVMALN